jgi:hypothetical protein
MTALPTWRRDAKMLRTSAAVVVAAAFTLVATAASAATADSVATSERGARPASFILGETIVGRTRSIVRLDPRTLRVLAGPTVALPALAWSFSPDRRQLVVGDDRRSELHFIDARGPRLLTSMSIGGGHIIETVWFSQRLLVLTRRCQAGQQTGAACAYRVTSIDPRSRRIVARLPLSGSVEVTGRGGGTFALLLGPSQGIGASVLAVIDAAGRLRTVDLPDVESGSAPVRVNVKTGYSLALHRVIPAVAVDVGGRTAVVLSNSPTVTVVDLQTLQVRQETVSRRTASRSVMPAARHPAAMAAPAVEGSLRQAAWLTPRSIVVWGQDDQAYIDANGTLQERQRPAGVSLIDITNWTQKALSPASSSAVVARQLVLTSALLEDSGMRQITGSGLSAFTTDGTTKFHLFGSQPFATVYVVASRAFVCCLRSSASYTIIDLKRGVVAANVRHQLPFPLTTASAR